MKFVVENVSHFLIASQVSAPWKMPICRKLATDDRLGHDPSRMMTRRNELTGSSLILFWQVSSLSLSLLLRLLTNAICLAVFLPSNNGERTRNESFSFVLRIRKKNGGRWSRGKSPPLPSPLPPVAVPFLRD